MERLLAEEDKGTMRRGDGEVSLGASKWSAMLLREYGLKFRSDCGVSSSSDSSRGMWSFGAAAVELGEPSGDDGAGVGEVMMWESRRSSHMRGRKRNVANGASMGSIRR